MNRELETPPNENDPGEAPKARILVIDDEEVVHVSLKRILGRRGHQIFTSLTAQEGLEIIESEQLDMVITDLMMPEMNGLELLEELKNRDIEVPILMITGYPTIKTALQALRLGAVDYLAKPFTRKELLAPVNRALRRQASGRDPKSIVPGPGQDGKPPSEQSLLQPGERHHLRRHSWIVYQQDGTVEVGIEPSFLNNVGSVNAVELPGREELVEQGYVGLRLENTDGEEHGVLMPLSGRVIAVNVDAAEAPQSITPRTWLVRVLPDRLESELPLLVPN